MQGMCQRYDTKVRGFMVLVKAVAVLSAILVLLGFGGRIHPIGDSCAVFRVELTILCALTVIWTNWPRAVRWPLVGMCLAVLTVHVVRGVQTGGSGEDFTLYQQNLLFDRTDGGAGAIETLGRLQPDFITFQEVSDINRPILDLLLPDYPSQQFCPLGDFLGEAVLSRFPAVPDSGFCSARDGLAGLQLETPHGPVWLVSVHLNWPWPKGQAAQIAQLIPDLKRLQGHVVLAGDFNSVAWSHAVSQIADASGTQRIGPYQGSFHLPKVALPIGIDHVLTSPAYAQTVWSLGKNGSDHNGLWAKLTRSKHD